MSGLDQGGGPETDNSTATLTSTEINNPPETHKSPNLLRRLSHRGCAAILAASLFSIVGVAESSAGTKPQAKKAKATASFIQADDYPWANAVPIGGGNYAINGNIYDPNGFVYRNCTSAAAYWEAKYGVKIPYGQKLGNANTWDDNAPKYGFKVDTTPRDGDIAIWNSGKLGHSAFVESVNPNNSTNTKDYNRGNDGKYNEEVNQRADAYIHFMTDAQRAAYEADYGLVSSGLFPRVEAVSPADFNGDGHADLAAFSQRGDQGTNLLVFPSLGNRLGGQQFWGNTGSDIPFANSRFLPGDKTGIGRDGLYALAPDPNNPNNTRVFFLRSSGQNFEAAGQTAILGYPYGQIQAMAGKFDRNNTTDLMIATPRGDQAPNLQVMASDGGYSYSSVKVWSSPGELRRSDATYLPVDLNHDGLMDVLAVQPHDANSQEEWWLQSASDHFLSPKEVGIPSGNSNDLRIGR